MDTKSVLITEDDEFILKVLRTALEKEQLLVLEARNGEEGLQLALEKHPRIILLDIVMPKMDGLTMLEKLRSDPWGETVHVVILSSFSDSDRVSKAMNKRIEKYFVKEHLDIDDVIAEVKRLLSLDTL